MLFFIRHDRREMIHFNVTSSPAAAWVWQQLIAATPWGRQPKYLIHDHDDVNGRTFGARLAKLGIASVQTPVRAPRPNAIAERLVRTLRSEVLDHIIVLNEQHLRAVLAEFVAYYNRDRPHRSLGLESPLPRSPTAFGTVVRRPVLGGLHRLHPSSLSSDALLPPFTALVGSAGPGSSRRASGSRHVRLGLQANLGQFSILVLLNAFVGAMVGLERTVLPLVGAQQFGLASTTAVLSFIASFGLSKALTNLAAGAVADRVGRRRVLLVGWLLGIPVPIMILVAPSWSWVVAANLLLGANQALCWSMTVNMKIDLVGPARRGLALGLNESAGYAAVGLATLAAAAAASAYGLRSGPFGLGIGIPIVGLALTLLLVRDTRSHVAAETEQLGNRRSLTAAPPSLRNILARVSWRDRDLFACSQAGLVNNLNDGMAWGLFPIFLSRAGLKLGAIALITAAYPLSWGVLQLGTGTLSDRLGRKPLIVAGMALQGVALLAMVNVHGEGPWLAAAVALGLGTALVYPTLLAAVSDVAHPSWRASAVGVYRLWRDLGYVVGALAAGLIADVAGIPTAIVVVALVTLASALIALLRLRETLPTQVTTASTYW